MDGKSDSKTRGHEQGTGLMKHETGGYYQAYTHMGNTAADIQGGTKIIEEELGSAEQEKGHWIEGRTVKNSMNENIDEHFNKEHIDGELELIGQGRKSGEVPQQNRQSTATQISNQEAYPTPIDSYIQQAPLNVITTENESKFSVKQEPDTDEISPSNDPRNNILINQYVNTNQPASVTKNPEQASHTNQDLQPENQQVEELSEEIQNECTVGAQHEDGYMQSNSRIGLEPHDADVNVFHQYVDVEHGDKELKGKERQNVAIDARCERKPARLVADDDRIFDEFTHISTQDDGGLKPGQENLETNSRPTIHAETFHQNEKLDYSLLGGYNNVDDNHDNDDENENDNRDLARTDSVERFIKENLTVDTTKRGSRQRDGKQEEYKDRHEQLEPSGDRTSLLRSGLQHTKSKLSPPRTNIPHRSFGIENNIQNPVFGERQIDPRSGIRPYSFSDQYMQQVANFHDPRGYDLEYRGSARGHMQAQQDHLRHTQQNPNAVHHENRGFQKIFAYNQMNPFEAYVPVEYQSNTRHGHQHPAFEQHGMNSHLPHHRQEIHKQATSIQTAQQFRSDGHNLTRRSPAPPASHHQLSGSGQVCKRSNKSKHIVEEPVHDSEGQSTDEDEPLKSRMKLHPSMTSQGTSNCNNSVMNRQTRSPSAHMVNRPKDQGEGTDSKQNSHKNPVAMRRPLPAPLQVPVSADPSSSEEISWKLPQFEIQYQPPTDKEDLPSAKVSIPNLVREEVILSPDHADQELHLLLNLFLPSQQALTTPDPAPAHAVLNFHTIALMVIEAYVQFEIGDELGFGLTHSPEARQRGPEAETYERVRDAKDADVDEVFFEVVDRWRAGMQSNKKPLKLIRGAQEFCDVALDVIYYIKEHGLLRPEPKVRKERSDKGVPRGPKKAKEEDIKVSGEEKLASAKGKSKKNADVEDEGKLNLGVKRGREANVNVLQAKKKRKVEEKKIPKAKKSLPTITVVKKR